MSTHSTDFSNDEGGNNSLLITVFPSFEKKHQGHYDLKTKWEELNFSYELRAIFYLCLVNRPRIAKMVHDRHNIGLQDRPVKLKSFASIGREFIISRERTRRIVYSGYRYLETDGAIDFCFYGLINRESLKTLFKSNKIRLVHRYCTPMECLSWTNRDNLCPFAFTKSF